MTAFGSGDLVEVFDGDRDRWCPGTVEGVIELRGTQFVTVKSDHEFEGDLPLTWAIPTSGLAELVRELKHDTALHIAAGGFGLDVPGCPRCDRKRDDD